MRAAVAVVVVVVRTEADDTLLVRAVVSAFVGGAHTGGGAADAEGATDGGSGFPDFLSRVEESDAPRLCLGCL